MSLNQVITSSSLLPEQKVILQNRYLALVTRYRQKYRRINLSYNSLRLCILVGSILIPALLTLQKDSDYVVSVSTYWVVFVLSIMVTLANSAMELFQLAPRNVKYWLHVQRLETEGWQYLNLTDRYRHHMSVTEAFQKFSWRIEKLQNAFVLDLLRLENKNKSSSSTEQDTTNRLGSLGASLGASSDNNSINGMATVGSEEKTDITLDIGEFQQRLTTA